jgi:hypothetical protein
LNVLVTQDLKRQLFHVVEIDHFGFSLQIVVMNRKRLGQLRQLAQWRSALELGRSNAHAASSS